METPYSVKVVPQQVLQDQQVIRLDKALQNVSGVTKFASNQGKSDGFIVRGFASNNIYRDGFFVPDVLGGGTATVDPANTERVEVLKGPGGPLKHTLLFGFDYFHIDDVLTGINCCQAAPAFNIFRPTYLNSAPVFDPAANFDLDVTQSWYGLYFQDQVELPLNLFALAGLRYDNAEGQNNLLGITVTEDDRLSPRGGLLWRPLEWLSLYGSYTENFGASNDLLRDDGKSFSAETAQQWEVGAKTEFWDGRLSTTLAYFDLTKQNISVGDPLDPNNNLLIGEAATRGVEIEVAGEILPGWRVIGGYAYTPFGEVTQGNELTHEQRK